MTHDSLSLGQCVALASIIETTAPKPGNVHRGADFVDVSYPDFLVSAIAIAPIFDRAESLSVGAIVREAVAATQRAVGTNTNLGMILLFAPLAKVPREQPIAHGIAKVLDDLTATDARDVYAAIIAARPGGLGEVKQADVHGEPPVDLIAAMRLAADRDLVARQYADGFLHVLTKIVPWLTESILQNKLPVSDAVVHVFLQSLAAEPDSLIARKCGVEVAANASRRAARVLESGRPDEPEYEQALGDFDFWLRSDHHRRNPGTTADLMAAGLFVCLRDGIIKMPLRLADSLAHRE